jgi:hypothetical protein
MKSTGYIVNGIYVKALGDDQQGSHTPDPGLSNITYKAYTLDKQRQDHAFDLIQPWVNGKPNEEFRTHYPQEAEEYYGKHQES